MTQDELWLIEHAASSLRRILPRIEARFDDATDPAARDAYIERVKRHFPRLFARLHALYGDHYDFFFHLESILVSATDMWLQRPAELKALDGLREGDPLWFQSNRMVGAMGYVDLFAGDLAGLREKIPYLLQLGITYLHLMPLFKTPRSDNDGGYAVSSYREVDPRLGTMEDLAALATELRHHGISLTLDFVFNHTSDEHEWARRALAGDREHQAYYRMYPNREMPDAFERTMPEVFTDDHPGTFTYSTRLKKWIWTTFHTYQWDLNYENPAVFNRMLEEMLFLANQGVEILRLDAVAYIWKRLGTNCQNLPEAHWVIQAFNAVASIAAPALVFKSEAIVHPDEHRRFLTRMSTGEHPGSFARGAPFQADPGTGTARVSGTCASLAGVEKALETQDEAELHLAIRRILLLHGIVVAIGGIPLIYLGDEIATLNDHGYDADPDKRGDSRWLHRGAFDWERAEQRRDDATVPGRVYQQIQRLVRLRGQDRVFSRAETQIVDAGNRHIFAFLRSNDQGEVFVLANFTERSQAIEARRLRRMGMRKTMVDLVTGRTVTATRELELEPYELAVLARTA